MFAKLLAWMALRLRCDATKDIKILVLRHQLAMLQRHTPRPRMSSRANWVLLWLGPTLTPRDTGSGPGPGTSLMVSGRSARRISRVRFTSVKTAHAERNDQ